MPRIRIIFPLLVILLTCCQGNETSSFQVTQKTASTPVDICYPPCWYNIIPGETSSEEALEIIAALPFVIEYKIEEIEYSTKISWFNYLDDKIISSGYVYCENNVVEVVANDGGFPVMTVRYLLKEYGPAEGIYTYVSGVETMSLRVKLYYPKDGKIYTADGSYKSGGRRCLEKDSLIINTEPIAKQSIDDYLENKNQSIQNEKKFEISPWPGFGCEGYNLK